MDSMPAYVEQDSVISVYCKVEDEKPTFVVYALKYYRIDYPILKNCEYIIKIKIDDRNTYVLY